MKHAHYIYYCRAFCSVIFLFFFHFSFSFLYIIFFFAQRFCHAYRALCAFRFQIFCRDFQHRFELYKFPVVLTAFNLFTFVRIVLFTYGCVVKVPKQKKKSQITIELVHLSLRFVRSISGSGPTYIHTCILYTGHASWISVERERSMSHCSHGVLFSWFLHVIVHEFSQHETQYNKITMHMWHL